MRFETMCALALVLSNSFACTKHNPASCCSSPVQCSNFGLDSITPCEGLDVCDSTGTCVAPTCMTGSDCPSGDVCVNEQCVTAPVGPPADLAYATTNALYTETIAIVENTPSSNGSPITSYSISPALPSGLTLDPSSGVVSGTPTSYTAIASYTVTGTNAEGSTTAVLTIAVGARDLIAAGKASTCVRFRDEALCWGDNTVGQLGDNSTTTSPVDVPVTNLSSGVQGIASSALARHACAVVNGGAQCWGDNSGGDLGNNSTTESNVPVPVSTLTTGVERIATGTTFSCALTTAGAVECWGANNAGNLGNGSGAGSLVPVPITAIASGARAIALGNDHGCAIVSGGVQCWGFGADGQLGNNTFATLSEPVPVSGIATGAQAITAGTFHSCAIVNGGAVCWGANESGELGDSSTSNSSVPVPVAGLGSGVEAITAGGNHTCAIVNGIALCWGLNSAGQLGNNSMTNSDVPVQVMGLTNVEAISAGNAHTCAVANEQLYCWGANASGQLGDNGAETSSMVPVATSFNGIIQP